MHRDQRIFPCILIALVAGLLLLTGFATYVFSQGPNGSAFAPPTPPPTIAPTSPMIVSLNSIACSSDVCGKRVSVVDSCQHAVPGSWCLDSSLRPTCLFGRCHHGSCVSSASDTTSFPCDCTCE